MSDSDLDFTIDRLGKCRIPSPMSGVRFTGDNERVLYHGRLEETKAWIEKCADPPAMEAAGPREMIFFDPSELTCGIVTCGGLCPGLNDVIRSIVLSLYHHYGVNKVYGFRYGYEGLVRRYGHKPLDLTPDTVNRINESGGTILGSSRGHQDPAEMAGTLADLKVGILFALGGDGTLRGAQKIAEEAKKQGLVMYAAHAEAVGARNGIGLVKLMGRDSGFIAAFSVLADSQVNFCLVPETQFTPDGFLAALKKRLESKGHAVIVVAEGAGQDLIEATGERDASGNIKYGDIGIFLRDRIKEHFKTIGMEINLKYIDPSYAIRSQPANPSDSAFCLLLGQNAVHAGMSGRTNMVVSFWNHQFTHVPVSLATSRRKKIDPEGALWSSVLSSTGQSREMR